MTPPSNFITTTSSLYTSNSSTYNHSNSRGNHLYSHQQVNNYTTSNRQSYNTRPTFQSNGLDILNHSNTNHNHYHDNQNTRINHHYHPSYNHHDNQNYHQAQSSHSNPSSSATNISHLMPSNISHGNHNNYLNQFSNYQNFHSFSHHQSTSSSNSYYLDNNKECFFFTDMNSNHQEDIIEEEEVDRIHTYAKVYHLCYYYLTHSGQCRYGEDCKYVHGLACHHCGLHVFNPMLPIEQQIKDHKEFCNVTMNLNITGINDNRNDNQSNRQSLNHSNMNSFSLNPYAKEFISSYSPISQNSTNDKHKENKTKNNSISSVMNKIQLESIPQTEIELEEGEIIEDKNEVEKVNQTLIKEEEDNEDKENYECGICYENVVASGNLFGILANCNHIFCYKCIKKWRSTILDLSLVKSCPLCRKISYFVVPSSIHPRDDEERNLIIVEYKRNRIRIPCKYYKYPERQFCPFGDECFYSHLLPNGERASLGEPHVQLEYRNYPYSNNMFHFNQSEEWWNLDVLRQIREIIESAPFDDHDIQTLLNTLRQIILISEGGRAFREPESILSIRHITNSATNNSEISVLVQPYNSSMYNNNLNNNPININNNNNNSIDNNLISSTTNNEDISKTQEISKKEELKSIDSSTTSTSTSSSSKTITTVNNCHNCQCVNCSCPCHFKNTPSTSATQNIDNTNINNEKIEIKKKENKK